MKYGETRSAPRCSSTSLCCMIPRKPPIAEPRTTPTRDGSKPFRFASYFASTAAASASRTLRSRRRASFVETSPSGSKPFTSAAMRTGNSLASNDLMKSMPLSPATAARHVDGASLPSGVTAPRPVTATLFIAESLCASRLPPADDEGDLGAAGADRSGSGALAEDAADFPRPRAADAADRAVGAPELRLRRAQPEADHLRDPAAHGRRGRRRRGRRRWRRGRRCWRRRRCRWRRRWPDAVDVFAVGGDDVERVGHDVVRAGAAGDRVREAFELAARDRVVSGATAEDVLLAAAVDHVRAADHSFDVGADPVVLPELAVVRDAVERDVDGRRSLLVARRVDARSAEEKIRAGAAVEHVVPARPVECLVQRAPHEHVVASAPDDVLDVRVHVVALTRGAVVRDVVEADVDPVGAPAEDGRVGARPAFERVRVDLTEARIAAQVDELVVPRPSLQVVVAAIGSEHIVAVAALDRVVPPPAVEVVRDAVAGD